MFARFKGLRKSVRALLSLYWINTLAAGIVGVFLQLYLYQRFTDISLNMIATLACYVGIMLAFCGVGYLASVFHINVKHGFFLSFLVTAAAIVYVPHTADFVHACLAMFAWGVGQGLFWLTGNTLELAETVDDERDYYSSMLSAGNQVLSLVGPALATVLIWLSGSILGWGTYTLLFIVAPALYLLGLFSFAYLRDYRPPPVEWADIRHYFSDRKNQFAQLYTFGAGIQQVLGTTIPPLAIFFILGTALRVGVYDTLFALLSVVCVLAIARYRTPNNRLQIYFLTTLGLILITIWFGYELTFIVLVVYTLLSAVLDPLNGVTAHVIDMAAMEIGRKETDFYATMLLRDFFLWVWRSVGGIGFLFLLQFVHTQRDVLSLGLYLIAVGFAINYVGAYLFMRTTGRLDEIIRLPLAYTCYMRRRHMPEFYEKMVTLPDRLYPFQSRIEGQWVRGMRSYNHTLEAAFRKYGPGHYGARLVLYRSAFHVLGSIFVIFGSALIFQDAFGSRAALYAVLACTALFISFQEFYLQRRTFKQLWKKAAIDWLGWVGPMLLYIFFH